MQQLLLFKAVPVSLLLEAVEPVILEDDSARSANRSSSVIVMRSEVGPIDVVISIAKIGMVVGMNFHAMNSFIETLSHECLNCFDNSVFVFDENLDSVIRIDCT